MGSGSTTLYVDGGDVKMLVISTPTILLFQVVVSPLITYMYRVLVHLSIPLNIDGDVDLDANLHLTELKTFVGDISITGNVLQTGIITATHSMVMVLISLVLLRNLTCNHRY